MEHTMEGDKVRTNGLTLEVVPFLPQHAAITF